MVMNMHRKRDMKNWSSLLSGSGATFLSLLSCAACPLCLPLYLGLLSVIGVEVGTFHDFILPIMAFFCLLTLGLMARQIYTHHSGWRPLVLAGTGALGMSFAALYDYDFLLYICIPLFMGGILWNKRILHHQEHGCC